eukprot:COSAG01_NODE_25877_length_730_cov_1.226624_2_plen_24_part_01
MHTDTVSEYELVLDLVPADEWFWL